MNIQTIKSRRSTRIGVRLRFISHIHQCPLASCETFRNCTNADDTTIHYSAKSIKSIEDNMHLRMDNIDFDILLRSVHYSTEPNTQKCIKCQKKKEKKVLSVHDEFGVLIVI